MRIELSTGRPEPLGASWDTSGVNFAVHSGVADQVEVCLFSAEAPGEELARFTLPGRSGPTFHGHVSGLPVGLLYGLRVHGPWSPADGHRCNPNKLLVDPYARALSGRVQWNESTRGRPGTGTLASPPALPLDPHDSGPFVPRAVIVDPAFDWEDDRPLHTPWQDSLIYELHVRGFSKQNQAIPEPLRGTYLGLSQPASIAHLQALGVTAVELLPIHEFVDDAFLVERGLSNYWGYSTLCFFAPSARYAVGKAPGAALIELKQMVKALHRAGIEVLLDVVYNHTCEGDVDGPILSLKGIDNAGYYALQPDGRYRDVTGCGNTISADKPAAAQLILESMRYWVRELHIDGFRFDLATTLGRAASGGFEPHADLLQQIARDPLLRSTKLIAEPWDLGPEGYRVGHFPAPMREWNDKHRDALRRFWKAGESPIEELTLRLSGSPDLFGSAGRTPLASINFVTAHDGFTLHDLVSYEQKHNEQNQEGNRDGSDHNEADNQGVEGETHRADVLTRRAQQKRNLLASLLLSAGVPMLLAGDELGRTQRGNNNAYCQDNELSWLDWQLDAQAGHLLDFCRSLGALRRRHALLRQAAFWQEAAEAPGAGPHVRWLSPDGQSLTEAQRGLPSDKAFALLLTPAAERAGVDAALLVHVNGSEAAVRFVLPSCAPDCAWRLEFDTALVRSAPALSACSFEQAARTITVWTCGGATRAGPGA